MIDLLRYRMIPFVSWCVRSVPSEMFNDFNIKFPGMVSSVGASSPTEADIAVREPGVWWDGLDSCWFWCFLYMNYHEFYDFPFSWEFHIFHHPNWRTHIFFRGVGWNQQPENLDPKLRSKVEIQMSQMVYYQPAWVSRPLVEIECVASFFPHDIPMISEFKGWHPMTISNPQEPLINNRPITSQWPPNHHPITINNHQIPPTQNQ